MFIELKGQLGIIGSGNFDHRSFEHNLRRSIDYDKEVSLTKIL